jgi:hypothetical protein
MTATDEFHDAMQNAVVILEKYKKICEIIARAHREKYSRPAPTVAQCDRQDRYAVEMIEAVLQEGCTK